MILNHRGFDAVFMIFPHGIDWSAIPVGPAEILKVIPFKTWEETWVARGIATRKKQPTPKNSLWKLGINKNLDEGWLEILDLNWPMNMNKHWMILPLLLLLLYETAAQSRHLNLRTEGIEELPEIRPPCRKPRTIFWISMGFLGFQLFSAGKKICHELQQQDPWTFPIYIYIYIGELLSILPQLYTIIIKRTIIQKIYHILSTSISRISQIKHWLVVSTLLKNMSSSDWIIIPQLLGKIKTSCSKPPTSCRLNTNYI